MVMAIADTSCL